VRFSTTHPGTFTISSNNGGIKHQRVTHASEGFLFNNENFNTLEQVISEAENLFIPAPGSKFLSLFGDYQSNAGYD